VRATLGAARGHVGLVLFRLEMAWQRQAILGFLQSSTAVQPERSVRVHCTKWLCLEHFRAKGSNHTNRNTLFEFVSGKGVRHGAPGAMQ